MTWNMITGLIATLIGVAYGWSAWNLPRATFGSATGHIVYPVILGALMTFLGLVLIVKELLVKEKPSARNAPKFGPLTRHGKVIVAVFFSVGVYVLFSVLLGIQLPRMPLLDI